MRSYRRILGLIDLSAQGETVARRALQMARVCNATLALAVIADYTPGGECDHVPPQRTRDDVVNEARAKLDAIITDIGAGGAEAIVVAASTRAAIEEIAESWQPDLILVGSHSPYGLQDPSRVEPGSSAELPADILVVQAGRPSLAGRLLHALSEAF